MRENTDILIHGKAHLPCRAIHCVRASCLAIFPIFCELFENKDYVPCSLLSKAQLGIGWLNQSMVSLQTLTWARLATELWAKWLGKSSLDCKAGTRPHSMHSNGCPPTVQTANMLPFQSLSKFLLLLRSVLTELTLEMFCALKSETSVSQTS